jgi:diguanylate cyclase (GGDEF)-like protein
VPNGRPRIQVLRTRLLVALGALFVVAMALVALAGDAGGPTSGWFLRLAVVAGTTPILMATLMRRVMEPAEQLGADHDRLVRLYSEARADALIDPITGLGNHRAFQEELVRQIEDARRGGHHLSLALIDLDDLKRINDERGHAGGDEVLAAMGRLMAANARAADRGFRIGGDEFAMLLPRADAREATGIARRLLAASLSSDGHRPGTEPFSFSAGLSAYPGPAQDRQQLFHQADAALYFAKRHGRTDVQLFDPGRHGAADEERGSAELAEAVSQIASQKALTPLYQTIYDLQTGAPIGYEGLVRPADGTAFHDALSLFSAVETAERSVELDRACVEVVAANAALPDGDAFLSINISPRTLEAEQFHVADLRNVLTEHGIPPERVVIELTEREVIEDMSRLRENIQRCRAEGFRVAADDVGAGNAGLRMLSEIHFDIVKIDLSLVQKGVLRESAMAVLFAIRNLAADGGAMVVAEGIETANQLEVVRGMDLVAGQGYLLGLPAPQLRTDAIDIAALLTAHAARRKALGGFLDLDLAEPA